MKAPDNHISTRREALKILLKGAGKLGIEGLAWVGAVSDLAANGRDTGEGIAGGNPVGAHGTPKAPNEKKHTAEIKNKEVIIAELEEECKSATNYLNDWEILLNEE